MSDFRTKSKPTGSRPDPPKGQNPNKKSTIIVCSLCGEPLDFRRSWGGNEIEVDPCACYTFCEDNIPDPDIEPPKFDIVTEGSKPPKE